MSISSDEEWHQAKLGLLLTDEENILYALTCKHVTQFPNDGKVYIQTATGKKEAIGTVLNHSPESCNRASAKFHYDIDVVMLDNQTEYSFSNWVHSILDKYNGINIFTGSLDTLFESSFSSLSEGKVWFCNEGNTASKAKKDETTSLDSVDPQIKKPIRNDSCITGKIQSKSIHEIERTDLPEYNILLYACENLFKPGDSGTVIVRNNKHQLELVGILTGSFKSEMSKTNYITCLLIEKGLEVLRSEYDKEFRILPANREIERDEDGLIMAGSVIWIKTKNVNVKSPDDIAEIDYDFVVIVLNLIDNMKDDDISPSKLQLEIESEKLLSNCVSSREHLESKECICDSPAVKCYYLCMSGCSFLYKGELEQAIQKLKSAAKMIIKLPCRNRMLCRIITYTTWTLLDTDMLDQMEEILVEAEPYIVAMKTENVCPNSSVGYYFYDYARFYIKQGKLDQALEKANASLIQFRQGNKPSVGKILALAMIARLYLNCGEDFEREHHEITDSRAHDAKELIDEARRLSSGTAVEEATLLLTETDLYHRVGNIQLALVTARKCLEFASRNNLKEERLRAEIRVKRLKKH